MTPFNRRQMGLGLSALVGLSQTSAWAEAPPQRVVRSLNGGGSSAVLEQPPTGLPSAVAADLLAISGEHGHRGMAIWHDGRLLFEHYDAADGPDTLYPGFSMAKTVLSLMVGLALQRGVLASVDQRVGDLIAAWRTDARGDITLRQLLQMRSGLHLYSLAKSEPQALAMANGPLATATALATPLAGTPGAGFLYANVNSQILGVALSEALKRHGVPDYASALQAWLWRPLGLGEAELELEAEGGHPRYFAGMSASLRDWLGLAALMASDGQGVVSSQWLDQMAQPSLHPAYGLHVWRVRPWSAKRYYGTSDGPFVPTTEPILAEDMLILDGAGGQRAYVSRAHRLAIVRMGHPSWTWEDSALPNRVLRYLS